MAGVTGDGATRLAAADLPPVVVLLGGPSAEHDVSVVSGTAIAAALADAGATVRQVLLDLDGPSSAQDSSLSRSSTVSRRRISVAAPSRTSTAAGRPTPL